MTDLFCDWCRRPGHTADDHPLPKDHPDYTAFYDMTDDELTEFVCANLEPPDGAR